MAAFAGKRPPQSSTADLIYHKGIGHTTVQTFRLEQNHTICLRGFGLKTTSIHTADRAHSAPGRCEACLSGIAEIALPCRQSN